MILIMSKEDLILHELSRLSTEVTTLSKSISDLQLDVMQLKTEVKLKYSFVGILLGILPGLVYLLKEKLAK